MGKRPYPEMTPGARAAMYGVTRLRPGMSGYHEQEIREVVEAILATSFCRSMLVDPVNVDVGLHAMPDRAGFMLTFAQGVPAKPPVRGKRGKS